MKKSIWKYTLDVTDEQSVVLPSGSRLLTVQVQNEIPTIWAEVDTEALDRERYTLRTYGTGHWVDDDPGVYLGTYQLMEGRLVFHVYHAKTEEVL